MKKLAILLIVFLLFAAPCFAATNVYYSVGQNTTDHKTGSPTLTIVSGTGTFSEAQTAPNMGVGDRVTYNTSSIAFISGKVSATEWTLVTAKGATPANVTGATVNSIAHAFSGLRAAFLGSYNASHLATTDLVTGDYVLNLPCYYDSGADASEGTIAGYTTGANNYIRIYTPVSTTTEANRKQRHGGKWTSDAFTWTRPAAISLPHVKIDGLQMDVQQDVAATYGVFVSGISDTMSIDISNSLIRGMGGFTTDNHAGIYVYNNSGAGKVRVWNNVIYDFTGSGSATFGIGLSGSNSGLYLYAYNNTTFRNTINYGQSGNAKFVAKNNIAALSIYDGYYGTFTTSDYNVSDRTSDTAGGAHDRTAVIPFKDINERDFHLVYSTTLADGGTDLSADADLPVTTDIDGETRTTWQVGADEYVQIGTSNTTRTVLTRNYAVHTPVGYNPATAYPVVIYLHGGGGDMSSAFADKMDLSADLNGFILVAPMGSTYEGRTFWNGGTWDYPPASGSCCGAADDVAFISAVIDDVSANYTIDTTRVYATGISNGGLMSNRLACELSTKITAIATVAPTAIMSPCTPPRSIAVINIHGTGDVCNPYDGGTPPILCGEQTYIRMPPAQTVGVWLGINGGSLTVSEQWYTLGDASCTKYPGTAATVLCRIEGMGHVWPSGSQYLPSSIVGPVSYDISFNQMWSFLSSNSMNSHPLGGGWTVRGGIIK